MKNGKLDLIVEECDNFYIKTLVREIAREYQIPVVMDQFHSVDVDTEADFLMAEA